MPDRDPFPATFARLKAILTLYVPPLVVTVDTPNGYSLDVPQALALPAYPRAIFFGAAQIRKNYVSYYLMPVYMFPDLLANMPDHLKKRMQGKACFNFTSIGDDMLAALSDLTAAGIERFRQARAAQSATPPS